ncbi:putative ABC transport system permease protein [Thermoactinomyces sp. DSM 45891]|uniref:ABC transporter permease n=1 Tax=Thermoactinomyces sp. DSM 45891 TaxID=1761907 RepID=UPI000919A245|nr:FtsX-like permease family protein [Thermoactinomyces sp. DSM 45891]SFX07824.1 putative ABC transport system permease protein [Thermoactinomyces sp. DSM 45891]
MRFRQFAFNNIRRNTFTYIAYFLSSSFAVMTFFTYLIFVFHPDITKTPIGLPASYGMKVAAVITFIFSFLFVLYSISAFLKARLKEFGILTILGAHRKQLNYLIFLENMFIGTTSVITGMFCGLLFSKLFLLFGENVLDLKLPMYVPMNAIWITIAAFMGLFLILSFMTTILIRQRRALEMVQGSTKPKKEPKASIWLVLLSVVSLILTPILVLQGGFINLSLALLFDMIGLYFFFTQLFVFIIRLLKKNRRYSWYGLNILWITELAYKMKDSARMFFMITIVATMACTTAGSVLAIQRYIEYTYTENPFAYTVHYFDLDTEANKKIIHVAEKLEQTLKKEGISYQKFRLNTVDIRFQHLGYLGLIRQSEYQEIAKTLSCPNVSLQDREALFIPSNLAPINESINKLTHLTFVNQKLSSKVERLKIKHQYPESLLQRENLVVVNDHTYDQIIEALASDPYTLNQIDQYLLPKWNDQVLPDVNSPEVQMGIELSKWEETFFDNDKVARDGFIMSRAEDYYSLKQVTSLTIFIGTFIIAIFSIFIASFLYFKLFIDLQQDQRYYHELSKMGLSHKEMRRAATKQIAILFYIPLFFSGIQTLVALSALNPLFPVATSTISTGLWAIGIFIAIQTVYFLIVRSRYLAQLKKVMV